MRKILKYVHLWATLTEHSFMTVLTNKFSASLFLIGKAFRFVFFIVFLLTIFRSSQTLAGYSSAQALFFFLTFNFIDTVTQLFFREVYRFRTMVVSGDFDLVLVKPMNALFRALAGGADPLDLAMLLPYVGLLLYVGAGLDVTPVHALLYILLLINGFVIATGFHILILALAVVTTEIDHAVMIYRDLSSMGRIPIDVYREPLRGVITFVIPVGVMMSFPPKALMGLLSPLAGFVACLVGFVFFLFSLSVWNRALSQYASASS